MTKQKINFWNSEKLLSLSAILISVSTLIVFVYQTRLIREQQYKSVYPHLNFSKKVNSSKNELTLYVRNFGIGPAIITSTKVIEKGKVIETDLGWYMHNLIQRDSIVNIQPYYGISSISRGIIPEKEKISMFYLYENDFDEEFKTLYNFVDGDDIEFVIEYESIYGEKWRVSNKVDVPQKID